jgi:hypothetical protein
MLLLLLRLLLVMLLMLLLRLLLLMLLLQRRLLLLRRRLLLLISHDGNDCNLGLPCHGHGNLISIRKVVIAQSSASIVFARVQHRATTWLLPMYRRPSRNGGQFGSRSHRGRPRRNRRGLSYWFLVLGNIALRVPIVQIPSITIDQSSPWCRKRGIMRSISGTRSNRSSSSRHCHPNRKKPKNSKSFEILGFNGTGRPKTPVSS